MIRAQESPLAVKEYVKTLKPIENFEILKEGQKIFNRQSLDVAFVDTFISYDSDRDIVEYKNYKGETWRGAGKGYWYFAD